MKRTVLLLLLLAALGGTDLAAQTAVGYSSNTHPLLGIPRYRGGRSGDTLVIVSAQSGSNQTGWVVSYDRGDTWHDVRARWMTLNDGSTPTWYSTDHSCAWFAGGLHIAFRGYYGSDPAGYRYVASPYADEGDMETVKFPAAGTDTYYPIIVATGANDVWLFDMSEGGSRDNLRYWHSTDRFATSTTGRVCTISEDPQNYWRLGVIIDGRGYPKVSIFNFSRGFAIWTYDPGSSSWDSSLVVGGNFGGLGRRYAHAEMNGLDHVVFTQGASGPLVHYYETSEGNFSSTTVAQCGSAEYSPQLCVYGEGASARLYVAFSDLSNRVCVKSWTSASGWDSDSTVVSGSGHAAVDPALVPQVPSSWGFVPIWYHNTNDNNLYFVKLNAPSGEVDTIPPAPVNDLGVVTGDEHGTIDINWSAPGDDGMIGSADSYLIRYSTSPIDAGNWNLATQVSSPPTPASPGSAQQLTIGSLTPDTMYYVGIKARDESWNESELSNIDSARAYLDLSLDVDESGPPLPNSFRLDQNYPNPFNPCTRISFDLPAQAHVRLDIYNIAGQSVKCLVDGWLSAGSHGAEWDASDASGNPVASGVYFYRLTADTFSASRKMLLIR